MIRWQGNFYACMAVRWPELEHKTKRNHLTSQWYKKLTAMDAKPEQPESPLNNINILNAGEKREKPLRCLPSSCRIWNPFRQKHNVC